VFGQISSAEQAGDDARRECEDFLEFERKELWRVFGLADLPRLIHQRRNQA
jgi:hypothetical protein